MTKEELEQLKHKYWKLLTECFKKEEDMALHPPANIDQVDKGFLPQDEKPKKDFPQDTPLVSKDIPQEATPLEKRVWVLEALMEEQIQRTQAILEWIAEEFHRQLVPCSRFKLVKKDKDDE